MGKRKDLSPRKKGQISVLLEVNGLKQKDIAKRLNVSTQSVSSVKKTLDLGRKIGVLRKVWKKKKNNTSSRSQNQSNGIEG